ncbi:MAG TPA: archaemetzincin [Lacunisphaera sp.]|nr:archaemetzincin [Lacunisphaera sp.]
MKRCGWIVAWLGMVSLAWAAFEPPAERERLRALGNLLEEAEADRILLTPDADFRPITVPSRNDWLMYHPERGQTFEEYRESDANRPDAARSIIYILPIGEFAEETSPPFDEIRTYATAFFQMEVRILPAYDPHDLEFEPRKNPRTGHRQVLTGEILKFLKTRLPADAYCLLGVTMQDLYPQRSWNYVFGQASLGERVGIYSLARYDPAFWGDDRGRRYREKILARSCKVLVHETAHMFGLRHCVHYDCVVNGSNHLAESDRKPQHLCPVCLRKLHHATALGLGQRYRDLAAFYRRHQWFDELDWVNRQLGRAASR